MSPENPRRIRELISRGQPITFFNWICPPRTPVWIPDPPTPLVACRFLGPRDEGFEESEPCRRLVDTENETRVFLKMARKCGVNFRYLKVFADDNPHCLYPSTLEIQGEKEIEEIFLEFFIWYQDRVDSLFGKGIEVVSWGEISAPYRKLYDDIFNRPFDDISPMLPKGIVEEEQRILMEHCGFQASWRFQIKDFTERVIRSYAAEGVVLNALEKDWIMPNQILLCDESTRVFPAQIEAGRKLKGIDRLPKIFVLYPRR
jgi:hypothetical protein